MVVNYNIKRKENCDDTNPKGPRPCPQQGRRWGQRRIWPPSKGIRVIGKEENSKKRFFLTNTTIARVSGEIRAVKRGDRYKINSYKTENSSANRRPHENSGARQGRFKSPERKERVLPLVVS